MKTMKITLVALFLVLSASLFAQSDLKFNSAVNVQVTPFSPYTVPAGKVLKTERADDGNNNSGNYIYLNGNINIRFYCNTQVASVFTAPVWVNAGQTIHASFGSATISGILFDLVP